MLTPAPFLQNTDSAKREWQIATYLSGRSASPIAGSTYSVHALREVVLNAKMVRGVRFYNLALLGNKI